MAILLAGNQVDWYAECRSDASQLSNSVMIAQYALAKFLLTLL